MKILVAHQCHWSGAPDGENVDVAQESSAFSWCCRGIRQAGASATSMFRVIVTTPGSSHVR